MISNFEIEFGARTLKFEIGRIANLAGGAVTLRYGDTMMLVTACGSKRPRPGQDFFPLTVDYEEKMYARGKIPGSFFKREGRPSSDATLMARITDRPLRPLFPKGYKNEVQIIASTLSVDMENPTDILGIIGASTALTISEIPYDDPIGACRIGLIEDELVVNPTYAEQDESLLDLVVAGTADAIMMVEAGAKEVSEDVIVEALRLAQEVNGEIVELIREIQAKVGKKKWIVEPDTAADEAESAAREWVGTKISDALAAPGDKASREDAFEEINHALKEALKDSHDEKNLQSAFYALETEAVRSAILEDGRRPDGRALTDLRDLTSEVGYLPRTHGSALFTRGETQALSIVTLGSPGERQRLDTLGPVSEKRYMHHYNFPPYSTGETGRMFTGRREIGHGMLAERALIPVLPSQEDFPYTIRVVSEIMSSNGSSSMASVCGSTMSLMDAGVPIKAPVAGIAMGLVSGEDGQRAVLTDIQGAEDHSGDMDFKVAGTRDGITALQMDIKVKGITWELMSNALAQAKDARYAIIDHMETTIAAPRAEMNEYAPRMISTKVPTDKIGTIIGPGGKVIRGMIDEFGVTIDVSDDGTVVIGSPNAESAEAALAQIEAMTGEVEVGTRYKGKVVRLMTFGAFVELFPGKDGLVHISELADERVPSVEAVVSIGDEIEVLVTEIDGMGRVNLSARPAVLSGDEKVGSDGGSDRNGGGGRGGDRPRSFDRGVRGGGRGGDRGGRGGFQGGDRSGRGSDRGPRRDGGGGGPRRRVGGFDGERRSGPPSR
ncbi:MAG: polyribonucleotide nucleotidyltransferase [Dehalococcoidia bacterium]